MISLVPASLNLLKQSSLCALGALSRTKCQHRKFSEKTFQCFNENVLCGESREQTKVLWSGSRALFERFTACYTFIFSCIVLCTVIHGEENCSDLTDKIRWGFSPSAGLEPEPNTEPVLSVSTAKALPPALKTGAAAAPTSLCCFRAKHHLFHGATITAKK